MTAQNLLAWQGAEPGTRGQERGGGRVRARVGRDGPEPRWNPEAPPRVHWPGAAAARRQEALAGSSPHPGPAGLGVSASKTPASSAFPHAIHPLRAADDSACSAGQATGRLTTREAGRRPDFAPAGACAAHRETSDCTSRLRAIFLQCATYHFTESTHYEIVFLPKTYIYILMLSRKSRMIDLLVLGTVSGQWVIFLPSVSMSFFIN